MKVLPSSLTSGGGHCTCVQITMTFVRKEGVHYLRKEGVHVQECSSCHNFQNERVCSAAACATDAPCQAETRLLHDCSSHMDSAVLQHWASASHCSAWLAAVSTP